MFEVEGWRVKMLTGQRTKTVNVFAAGAEAGEKEYVVRLAPPFPSESEIRAKAFPTIGQLIQYLLDSHGGELENRAGGPGGSCH